jgi:hypothetical protein
MPRRRERFKSLSIPTSEMEHETGGKTQVVLHCGHSTDTSEARKQVIGFDQANGETRAKAQIDAAAHGHGKTVLSGVHARGTGVQAATAEQHLSKGNDAARFLQRNSRAEHIRIHRTVDTARQTAEAVSPQVRHSGEAIVEIVRERSARAVQVEAAIRIVRVGADVGVFRGSFKLRHRSRTMLSSRRAGPDASEGNE